MGVVECELRVFIFLLESIQAGRLKSDYLLTPGSCFHITRKEDNNETFCKKKHDNDYERGLDSLLLEQYYPCI
jgi:hypothetical protein